MADGASPSAAAEPAPATAATPATSSTSAPAPAPTATSQPSRSREEMEIARHLIAHSQSVPVSAPPPLAPRNGESAQVPDSRHRDVTRTGTEERPEQHPPSEHHDLKDSVLHGRENSPSSVAGTPLQRIGSPSQRSVSQGAVIAPGGQACTNCGTTKTPLWRRSPAGEIICNACGLYYKARNQMRPVGLKRGSAAMGTSADGQGNDPSTTTSSIQSQATYVSADPSANGTCPGGGRCNGTGGHDGCNGCPAYNNRISKTAQVALQQTDPNVQHSPHAQGNGSNYRAVAASVVVACQNCGTTITPLWRRDEAGNTICNACGLYHKLHGSHRPVQMKKPEIKRRKRVVPANTTYLDSGSPRTGDLMDTDSPLPSEPRSSMPPATSSAPLSTYEERHPPGGPIPVDFTGAFRPRTYIVARSPSPSGASEQDDVQSIPRKRSFSTSRDENEPPHTRSPPPPVYRPRESHIDPSLSASRDSAQSSTIKASTTSTPTSHAKESRRAELQREAERMREMLLQKERELAELGNEG